MSKYIDIKRFLGVKSRGDPADIGIGQFTELENLKPIDAKGTKLVKTFGFGDLSLNAISTNVVNIVTHINENLSGGFQYYAYVVNASTKVVTLTKFDGGTDVSFVTGHVYYHKNAHNPIIQTHDAIRFLAGNVGYATGTTEAKGLWYGHLERNFFWNSAIKTIDAFFDSVTTPANDEFNILSTAAIIATLYEGVDDGAGNAAFLTDTTQDWVVNELVGRTVYNTTKDESAVITSNTKTTVVGTLSGGADWDIGNEYYISFPSALAKDTYYYKITALLDGVQETLLSDTYISKAVTEDGKSIVLQITFDGIYDSPNASNLFNDRITALKIYRSTEHSSGYALLKTIGLLEDEPNLIYKDDSIVGYGLYVTGAGWTADEFKDKEIVMGDYTSGIASNSTDVIKTNSSIPLSSDYWDDTYYFSIWNDGTVANHHGFEDGGIDAWAKVSGTAVANDGTQYHSGVKSLKCTYDIGVAPADATKDIGGLATSSGYTVQLWVRCSGTQTVTLTLNGSLEDSAVVGTTWTKLSGVGFTGATTHMIILVEGDDNMINFIWIDNVVCSSGTFVADHSGSHCYAGKDTIINDDYNFDIEDGYKYRKVLVGDNTNGNNDASANIKTITSNVRRALKVDSNISAPYRGNDIKVYLCRNYLWRKNAANKVDLWFYDDGSMTPGDSPPLNNENIDEKSIKVNSKYALVINDLLIQANIVLDPGGENEVYTDGYSHSYPGCLDVSPVSYIGRLQDREGGGITGLARSFSSVIFFKEHAIFRMLTYGSNDFNDWKMIESLYDKGNIAPFGVVNAGNMVYYIVEDGIYKLHPNIGAETDATPMIHDRISEDINDVFEGLSLANKKLIQGRYDQLNNEIIWRFTNSVVWAFNTKQETWRKLVSGQKVDLIDFDENANVIIYDDTANKLYSIDIKESVATKIVTKKFIIGENWEKSIVRYLTARYLSEGSPPDDIIVKISLNGGSFESLSDLTDFFTTLIDRTFTGGSTHWENVDLGTVFDDTTNLSLESNAIGQYCKITFANIGTNLELGKRYRLTYDYDETLAGYEFKLVGAGIQTLGNAVDGTEQTIEFTAEENYAATDYLGIFSRVNATAEGDFDNFSIIAIKDLLGTETQQTLSLRRWAKCFRLELSTVASLSDVEIKSLRIEVD